MPFASYMALRFLGSRRSLVVLLVSVLSVLGIAIGVLVMNVTLAVMNGFRAEIQLRFVENMPMVTVLSWDPKGLTDYGELLERIDGLEDVEAAAPFVRQPGVLSFVRPGLNERYQPCILWGIDAARQFAVTPLDESISPQFESFDSAQIEGEGRGLPGMILGVEIAASLAAGRGEVVTLTVPVARGQRLEETKAASADFVVLGVLETGMFEFDSSFVYADLETVRELCQRVGVDGVGIRIADMMQAEEAGDRLAAELGPPYWTNDWIRMNSQLFEWIAMEKTLMFLLLALMSVVSIFAVIAILTMIVRDRQFDIAVLRSLGVSRRQVIAIFLQVGLLLGFVGLLLGTALGMAIIAYLHFIGWKLPGEVYFVDHVPVQVRALDLLLIAVFTMFFSLLATVLPSWIASTFKPVEILRHE